MAEPALRHPRARHGRAKWPVGGRTAVASGHHPGRVPAVPALQDKSRRWPPPDLGEPHSTHPHHRRPPVVAMTPVPLRRTPIRTDAQGVHRRGALMHPHGGSEGMPGIVRALGRLLVMGLVMAGVLVAAVFAGVGPTTALALGIVLAGIVGLIGVGRRPRAAAPMEQVAAMQATLEAAAATQRIEDSTAVDAMAPPLTSGSMDVEAN